MTTVTSSSKKKNGLLAVFVQDLRRVRSLSLFYWVISFFLFPLQYILQIINPREYANYAIDSALDPLVTLRYNLYGPGEIYGTIAYVLFFPLMIVMSILFATQLLSYMQNKRAVDVYHALPVTRTQMMTGHFMAGVTSIGLPLLVNFLIIAVVKVAKFGTAGLGAMAVEYLCWMITAFVIFSITAFAAVNVGTMFDTGIFALVLNGIVPLLYLLCMLIFDHYLYGYVSSYMPLLKMHPLVLLVLRQSGYRDTDQVLWDLVNKWFPIWLGIGIVIMLATIWIYTRRKSETAESLQTSSPLKIVLKLAGTFVGSILFGILFESIFGYNSYGYTSNNTYFIFGILLGAALSYLIIEVVLARGFKTLKRQLIPGALAVLAMGAFAITICNGGLGYVTRVPKLSNVESVMINYNGNSSRSDISLSSEDAKETLVALHQTQVDVWQSEPEDVDSYTYEYGRTIYLTLEYTMKNGTKMHRQYTTSKNTNQVLLNLHTADEFIEKTNKALLASPEQITSIILSNPTGEVQTPLTLTWDQIAQLQAALKEDLFNQTIEQLKADTAHPVGFLTFEFSDAFFKSLLPTDGHYYINNLPFQQSIDASFTATQALLNQWGHGEKMVVDLSHIAGVSSYYSNYGSEPLLMRGAAGPSTYSDDKSYQYYWGSESYTIDDPEKIAELYELSRSALVTNQRCFVLLFQPVEEYTNLYYSASEDKFFKKDANGEYYEVRSGAKYTGDYSDLDLYYNYSDWATTEEANVIVPDGADSIIPAPSATRFLLFEDAPDYFLEHFMEDEYLAEIIISDTMPLH